MATTEFPSPLPNDVEDVVLALDLGRSLWIKGEVREAVRWLRTAAAAAESAGDDMRGVRLAGLAADIATEFSLTSLTPPPPAAAPGPPPPPPPVRVSAKPPPLPDRPASQLTPPVKVSTRPPPLPASAPPPAEHDTQRSDSSFLPHQASASSLPPPAAQGEDAGTGPRRGRTGALKSYRVYVEQASDGGLKVHPMREGETLPSGAREAILVIAESGGGRHAPKAD